jgi:hypothetical protein
MYYWWLPWKVYTMWDASLWSFVGLGLLQLAKLSQLSE